MPPCSGPRTAQGQSRAASLPRHSGQPVRRGAGRVAGSKGASRNGKRRCSAGEPAGLVAAAAGRCERPDPGARARIACLWVLPGAGVAGPASGCSSSRARAGVTVAPLTWTTARRALSSSTRACSTATLRRREQQRVVRHKAWWSSFQGATAGRSRAGSRGRPSTQNAQLRALTLAP